MRSHIMPGLPTISLVATSLVAACLGFWTLGNWQPADHAFLPVEEQRQIVGGQGLNPQPVNWQNNKLCLTPTQQGGPCNLPRTFCDVGNTYCQAIQQEDAVCADAKEYKNPLRCVASDTDLQCADEVGNPTVCYVVVICRCIYFQGIGWQCVRDTGESSLPVNLCEVRQHP
jgi:hypothetical protein